MSGRVCAPGKRQLYQLIGAKCQLQISRDFFVSPNIWMAFLSAAAECLINCSVVARKHVRLDRHGLVSRRSDHVPAAAAPERLRRNYAIKCSIINQSIRGKWENWVKFQLCKWGERKNQQRNRSIMFTRFLHNFTFFYFLMCNIMLIDVLINLIVWRDQSRLKAQTEHSYSWKHFPSNDTLIFNDQTTLQDDPGEPVVQQWIFNFDDFSSRVMKISSPLRWAARGARDQPLQNCMNRSRAVFGMWIYCIVMPKLLG